MAGSFLQAEGILYCSLEDLHVATLIYQGPVNSRHVSSALHWGRQGMPQSAMIYDAAPAMSLSRRLSAQVATADAPGWATPKHPSLGLESTLRFEGWGPTCSFSSMPGTGAFRAGVFWGVWPSGPHVKRPGKPAALTAGVVWVLGGGGSCAAAAAAAGDRAAEARMGPLQPRERDCGNKNRLRACVGCAWACGYGRASQCQRVAR